MSGVLTIHGWLLFGSRLIGLGLAATLLCEAVARLGGALLVMFRVRPRGGLADFGIGLLLGWAVLGSLWLGVGLAGLYYPAVIAGTGLAALAASRATWRFRSPVAAALRQARGLGAGGAWAALGVFALLAGRLCIPEFEIDCAYYHFGVAWQWLEVHRAILSDCQLWFHLSLPVEMLYVLPVMLGDDRLAKWIAASFFLAAAAAWAGRCLPRRPAAGWLGPLFALSGSTILWLVAVGKNDVPVGGCFVAGAVVYASGAASLGAFLLGCALAAKYTAGPLVVAWIIAFAPGGGFFRMRKLRLGGIMLLLVAPALPWLVKTWLATGNPCYPFGARWIPSLGWNAANQTAFLECARPFCDPATEHLATFFGALVAAIARDHLIVLLALPALLLLGRDRRAAWASVAGLVGILAIGHFGRYMLPGFCLLAFLAADEVAALAPAWRRVVVPAAGVLALASMAFSSNLRWSDQAQAFRPLGPVLREFMTTRGELIGFMRKLPRMPGRPLRVLSSGEGRSYLWPARLVCGGVQGETPLIWQIAQSSRTTGEINKRFRQLGTTYLLHNFVSAEWLNIRYRAFNWDPRMVRLYVEFCLRHLVVEYAPERSDYGNGGSYLFRILPRPLARPQPWLFYLPGAESLYGPVTTLENMGRPADALAISRNLLVLMPEVGHAWNEVGHFLTALGDTKGGFEALRVFVERGMLDGMNVGEFGANAVRVREYGLASRTLTRTLRCQPDHRDVVFVNLGVLWVFRAVDDLGVRRYDRADALADRAAWALSQISDNAGSPAQRRARLETTSLIWALRGELARVRGDAARAAVCFRTAWQTTPDMALSPRWKELADTLSPKMFGTR